MRQYYLGVLAALAGACGLLGGSASAADWAYWRGPQQNGVSLEKDLPSHISLDPSDPESNLIWKSPFGGRDTPIILNNRLYYIDAIGDGVDTRERILCLDADTGREIWHHDHNVWHTDIVRVRLGWTDMVGDEETGNVYAHGTQGLLIAYDKDGKELWRHSLAEEYGRVSGYGGRLTSPIVDEDRLVLGFVNSSWGQYASGGTRYMAFDKRTGAVIWESNSTGRPKDTYYSHPVVATIGGVRLIIGGTGDGSVVALKARTGELAWQYSYSTGAINCSPVIEGNRVYIGHGEPNFDSNKQGNFLCLDASEVKDGKPKLVWKVDGLKARFASPVLHDGRLYVCDSEAKMFCLDAKDGKQLWRFAYGRQCVGSPVWADGKLYIGEVNSKFHILEPGDKSCKRLCDLRFSTEEADEVEINGSPAIYKGRVYFTTSQGTYCFGKKDRKAEAVETAVAQETLTGQGKPTHLLIVPAEVEVHPGDTVTFKARLFDEHGNLLKEVPGEWSLAAEPPPEGVAPAPPKAGAPAPAAPPALAGTVRDGKLTVDKARPLQMGRVIAKAEGLTGHARVRVVPTLPFKADFSKVPDGRTPAGWVNTQGKFSVQEIQGKKVLVKLSNNASPLLARANAYFGLPSMKDYTIECDVQGTKKGEDMPDMGVCANRYTLLLDGVHQTLRIYSWDALPRVDKTMAFAWEPGKWYRLKLTVDVEGGKAVVKGKAWPRDKEEPKEWTIQVNDPHPTTEGCPTVYGATTGIINNEPGNNVFFDNLVVTPNKK